MFYRVRQMQYNAKPEKPDPLYARKLQEVLGGATENLSTIETSLSGRVAGR